MIAFLLKVWGLAKPYKTRMFLGVLTGVLSGLVSPLLIGTIMFVYSAVFPTQNDASGQVQLPMNKMPVFLQHWFEATRAALENGVQTHRWMVAALVAAIPVIMLLRGLFGYLNVYCLQWVASRTIADLRVRLFGHLLNLSAGFHNVNASGQLISRVVNDTGMLQVILNKPPPSWCAIPSRWSACWVFCCGNNPS